jgi:RNA polymerase sigma-70 factor (ECF subfamily)
MRIDPRLNGRIDPSDVVQETYLDATRRIGEFQSQAKSVSFLTWFRFLAVQRLVDLHRRHLGTQARDASLEVSLNRPAGPLTSSVWLADQILDHRESGSEAVLRTELREMVRAALDQLDPLDREVLAMRHYEMLSNQEVAALLEISVKASSNRYVRGVRRLQSLLPIDARPNST